MVQQAEKIDRDYILQRLSNWKTRLNHLFSEMEKWTEGFEEIEIKRSDIPQSREELMRKFDIAPDTFPSTTIIFGEHRASFIPMGLWVIGSNGRVNITTKKNQYMLVNLGEDDKKGQWMVVNPSKRRKRISFNDKLLEKIIKDEDIFK